VSTSSFSVVYFSINVENESGLCETCLLSSTFHDVAHGLGFLGLDGGGAANAAKSGTSLDAGGLQPRRDGVRRHTITSFVNSIV
jgi:hypothetical protein